MNWIVLLFVLLASPAWAMEHYSQPLQDQSGRAITNALVSVYLTGTSTLATIYSDNGTTTKANPMRSGATSGVVSFYAANGGYDLVYSKTGYTFTAADSVRLVLFDPADFTSSGGGASTFDELGSGTNTTATMTVSTGAVITYSGSGVNNANQFKGNSTVAYTDGGTGLVTATDDAVMVGSGTGWISTALPSCSNASTSKLLYNSSTNAFSCGTDQSAGGGTTFDGIGSGTNTTATMSVGLGATLTPSTGQIAANSVWPHVTTVNAGNSPLTLAPGNMLVLCDTSAAARVLTLPSATAKQMYQIKNLGSSTCTINRAGSDTIDGGTSAVLNFADESITLISDASSEWQVF